MTTTVTAAHHSIWKHLYDCMTAAQKPKSKLKFITLDKKSNMSTLWRREEFLRVCSKGDRIYLRIQMVDRQGQGVPRGERRRSK